MQTFRLNINKDLNPNIVEDLKSGLKKHFIVIPDTREQKSEYINSFKEINSGNVLLSIVTSDDKHGEYIIEQYENIEYDEINMSYSPATGVAIAIDNKQVNTSEIIENNGMTTEQFIASYFHSTQIIEGFIIYINDSKKY